MADAPSEVRTVTVSDVLNGGHEGTLYCVVDAAAAPSVYEELRTLGVRLHCLYRKGVHFEGARMGPELAAAAPYLVPVDAANQKVVSFVNAGCGKARQILVSSPAPVDKVQHHCSEILRAQDEQGSQFHFRFFDPRVLRVYLPTCTPEEKALFVGPLSAVWAEAGEGRSELLAFEAEKPAPVEEPKVQTKPPESKIATKKQQAPVNLDYMSMYLDNQK